MIQVCVTGTVFWPCINIRIRVGKERNCFFAVEKERNGFQSELERKSDLNPYRAERLFIVNMRHNEIL